MAIKIINDDTIDVDGVICRFVEGVAGNCCRNCVLDDYISDPPSQFSCLGVSCESEMRDDGREGYFVADGPEFGDGPECAGWAERTGDQPCT